MANLAETKGMRIYVATPINARHEKTFEEKREMAAHRCELLKKMLREEFAGAEIITPFDVNPIDVPIEENEAIGKCVAAVLTCNAIYLDHAWQSSKGCNLEYRAAKIYGLIIYEYDNM